MQCRTSSFKGFQSIILGLMVCTLSACEDAGRLEKEVQRNIHTYSCPHHYQCLDAERITARHIAVDGTIRAEEILVETVGADYVFSPSYELKSLEVVEGFINEHRHLPGIPSSASVEAAGGKIAIGDSYRGLLEKIEELTLYTIDQDKRIAELEKLLISQYENKGSSPAGH